jgi:hypothetical protein
MCDASDCAMRIVLGQTKDRKHHAISYASKTLSGPQLNYATTEKELLAVVFAIDKFRSYLVGAKVIFYTDPAPLKYLLTKKDAKPQLIRLITCQKCSSRIHRSCPSMIFCWMTCS